MDTDRTEDEDTPINIPFENNDESTLYPFDLCLPEE